MWVTLPLATQRLVEANTDDSNVVGDEKIYRALTRWLQATLPIKPSSALNVAETKLGFTLRGGWNSCESGALFS